MESAFGIDHGDEVSKISNPMKLAAGVKRGFRTDFNPQKAFGYGQPGLRPVRALSRQKPYQMGAKVGMQAGRAARPAVDFAQKYKKPIIGGAVGGGLVAGMNSLNRRQ